MFTFDKPFIAHTKESNAVIDNYLDSICLISSKWYSITRELEILNYWCGVSKESLGNMQILLLGAQVGPRHASLLPFTHLGEVQG